MRRALAQIGMSIDTDPEQRLEMMRLAGFGDASRERVEIGLADPKLIAPHNERQRMVVAQYKLLLDLSEGLEAMCTALFYRVLGMPLDHIRAYCQSARQDSAQLERARKKKKEQANPQLHNHQVYQSTLGCP